MPFIKKLSVNTIDGNIVLAIDGKDKVFSFTTTQYATWLAAHPKATPADVEALGAQLVATYNLQDKVFFHCFSVGPPPLFAMLIATAGETVPSTWWQEPSANSKLPSP